MNKYVVIYKYKWNKVLNNNTVRLCIHFVATRPLKTIVMFLDL